MPGQFAFNGRSQSGCLCTCAGEVKKNRASEDASAGFVCSVLAGQVDHLIGEIHRDFVEREIGVFDFLREHDVAVAIIAGGSASAVGQPLG